ncbi:MAG: translesion error-prone DNA polymerase V autoproteolytic subunit [Alphaproteobacteria bacterium]|nr:translesion error-prone DNA polymerase V autoproteolytic subunit [Alphaproteobacteria bacterium]MDD9920596.1 translesion error-prone DNA polymerase V autoproteolytic subunit [Alphaproteobacteria bacterium]
MTRGGKRTGAGRPTGTGQYGEETKPVRVPVSKVNAVKDFIKNETELPTLPLYGSDVQAGGPTPADDYVENQINLHDYVVERPAETFFVRAKGQSMKNIGIGDGDLMVVDRSIAPRNGHVVIAAVDGDLTVKRLNKTTDCLELLPENEEFQPIRVSSEQHCHIWGVVTNVIHRV